MQEPEEMVLFVGIDAKSGELMTTDGGRALYGPKSFWDKVIPNATLVPLRRPLVGGAYMSAYADRGDEVVLTVRGSTSTMKRLGAGLLALADALKED